MLRHISCTKRLTKKRSDICGNWRNPEKEPQRAVFLRLQQQEFYEEGYGDGAQLKYYPGVSVMT